MFNFGADNLSPTRTNHNYCYLQILHDVGDPLGVHGGGFERGKLLLHAGEPRGERFPHVLERLGDAHHVLQRRGALRGVTR
jgi:hypothetical protein